MIVKRDRSHEHMTHVHDAHLTFEAQREALEVHASRQVVVELRRDAVCVGFGALVAPAGLSTLMASAGLSTFMASAGLGALMASAEALAGAESGEDFRVLPTGDHT